jgi:lambda family phage portal protein
MASRPNLIRRTWRAGVAAFRRAFDAAGHGDRWPTTSQLWSPVSQSLAAAGPISKRADWLVNNSPTAASFVECWISSLSAAPTARSQHPNEATRSLLEKSWNRFALQCDAEGNGDLGGYLAKAVRTLVVSGDAFTHMIIRDRQLRLKLLNSEQVWRPLTRIEPNGHRIFAGVEVNPDGRRVAYWTLPQQPDLPWAIYPLPERISADDMLHVFTAQFPGAVRGLSWLTPIAARLLELDKLEDAILARMNVAALFSGFIRDLDGTTGIVAETQIGHTGKNELSMEPGTLRVLPPGTDIVFPQNLPDIGPADGFLRHILRSIASGGGVPSSLLTGDLSDVNYSSSRLGLEQFKRAVARVQKSHLVAQLLQPVWERFVTVEILSGRLAARDFEQNPENYYSVEFRWPGWASLDPVKDAQADDLALRNHLKSRAEIVAARGRDIADVDREIDADPKHPEAPTVQPQQQPQQDNADA